MAMSIGDYLRVSAKGDAYVEHTFRDNPSSAAKIIKTDYNSVLSVIESGKNIDIKNKTTTTKLYNRTFDQIETFLKETREAAGKRGVKLQVFSVKSAIKSLAVLLAVGLTFWGTSKASNSQELS